MASEVLRVPEDALAEVIAVIRAGLGVVKVRRATKSALLRWCDEEQDYLRRLTAAEEGR